ncbi:MAG: HD domain-containing protein [Planctomycetales bacterium]|jgi:hypothetical protein
MNSSDAHTDRLEESRFFQRRQAAANSSELETTVRMVCKNIDALTTTVSGHFHAYTLHDMTHLWNVIGIMEELIPEQVWDTPWQEASDPLGPFQCALCLMAGLVHDIGMAPPAALIDKLKEVENLDNPIPKDADRESHRISGADWCCRLRRGRIGRVLRCSD